MGKATRDIADGAVLVEFPQHGTERANEAANRAIGLTNKSKEATDKGQGTGHTLVAARVRSTRRGDFTPPLDSA